MSRSLHQPSQAASTVGRRASAWPVCSSGAFEFDPEHCPRGGGDRRLSGETAGLGVSSGSLCKAIHSERIVGIDAHGTRSGVRLRVRADDRGGKRTVAIDGAIFIARFLQHVLPSGFKRIRHYGLLSPVLKTERLAIARAALEMPPANAQAREDAAAFLKRVAGIDIAKCPHCQCGRWLTIEVLPPARSTSPDSGANCRGPP